MTVMYPRQAVYQRWMEIGRATPGEGLRSRRLHAWTTSTQRQSHERGRLSRDGKAIRVAGSRALSLGDAKSHETHCFGMTPGKPRGLIASGPPSWRKASEWGRAPQSEPE